MAVLKTLENMVLKFNRFSSDFSGHNFSKESSVFVESILKSIVLSTQLRTSKLGFFVTQLISSNQFS